MPKASEEARKLWPYLQPLVERALQGVSRSGGGGSGSATVTPTTHALSSSIHTGTLADAQAPQFLKSDGSRALTGHLSVGAGITIDGVDLDVHAANADAHHQRASAGDGISVSASQQVAVNLHATPGLEFSTGLLKVKPTNGIVLNSSGVGVSLASNSGLEFLSGALQIDPYQGLTKDANGLSVWRATDSGLAFHVSGALQLGTPSTVSATSTNSISGMSHTHAADAASDVSGVAAAAKLLKSTPAGGLGLSSMFTSGAVDVGQGFTAGNTGFRVIYHTHDYPHTHVVVNPTGSWSLDEQFGLDVDDNLLVRGWIVGKHAIQVADAKMLVHFDGPAPLETNFKGNPTGHMGQSATRTGGVIYREGKFGKALCIGRAQTNMIINPSFETVSTGWTALNGTSTISRNSSDSTVGLFCLWVQSAAAFSGVQYGPLSLLTGVTYTLSFDVKLVSGASAGWIVEANRITAYASKAFTPTSEWQRVTFSFVANATAANHALNFFNNAAAFSWIAIDAVQLEAEVYATPYFDGSLDDNLEAGNNVGTGNTTEFAWTGTAHASTSTRTAGYLTYSDQSLNDFSYPMTVLAWIKPFESITYQPIAAKINGTATEGWELGNYAGWVHATIRGPDVQIGNAVAGCALTIGAWNFVGFTYDGATLKVYNAGTLAASTSGTGTPATLSPLLVGRRASDSSQYNGYIDELSLIGRVLTEDEIRAIYESNAPIFAETSTWHWRAGRNRIYADSEGLWGYGASGGAIIGLYAGEDNNPSATKSWGGLNLSEGDFLLGRYGVGNGGWMFFDQDLVSGKPSWRFGWSDRTVIALDALGATLEGVLDIGTDGGIYQGTGTFNDPLTGLKMWTSGGIGLIGGYNAGTLQWSADTDGRLKAGAGNVVMDASGLNIVAKVNTLALENYPTVNSVLWKNSGNIIAGINGQFVSSFNTNYLLLNSEAEASGRIAAVRLQANGFGGSGSGSIEILSNGTISLGGAVSATSLQFVGGSTLSNYLQSTWTPVITGSTSNPTPTYTAQTGTYTRIGNVVLFTFTISYSAIAGGSGDVRISMPIAVGTAAVGVGLAPFVDVPGTPTNVTVNPVAGTSYALIQTGQDNAANLPVQVSGLAAFDIIVGSGFYFV